MTYLINLTYSLLAVSLIPKWLYKLYSDSNFRSETRAKIFWQQQIKNSRDSVWMHGASVGEVALLKPLVTLFEENNPERKINLSTYTLDGYRYAKTHYINHQVFLLPFDISWTMQQLVKKIDPQLIILSELELWPNLLLAAGAYKVPVAVVNSRINDNDYRFFKSIHLLLKQPLKSIKWWGAQTESDASRIRSLIDSMETTIQVTRSMKYDLAITPTRKENVISRESLGYQVDDLILVGGSTHKPEESMLLSVFSQLRKKHPHFHLILVPRHPSRSLEISSMASRLKLDHELLSSRGEEKTKSDSVLIVDQIGLLADFWPLCNFAFVGGSLGIDHGGQNMIEPASLGKPTCFGKSIYNFQETATLLLEQDGAAMVENESELLELITDWISHPDKASQTGSRGAKLMESQRGATEMTFESIREFLRE